MQISVNQLAKLVAGTVEGDGEVLIDRPAKIEEAGPGSISFLGNMKYENYVYSSQASALLVPTDFVARRAYFPALIRVPEVYSAVSTLLSAFSANDESEVKRQVSAQAQVSASAQLGERVRIGKFTVVEANVQVGDGTIIQDQVYIGNGAKIGRNCVLFPGVRIMHGCVLGDECVIHPNTVIGSDGFGFAPQSDKTYEKVPQVGNVILEDRVEIGSNCTIDRATMGSTIIRRGVKMDNLIQIAHNVEIGENTVIASQTGIAGSTKIGANCKLGGQSGFAGHLSIANGSNFQAQSGVMKKITVENGTYWGSPALDYSRYMRSSIVFKDLPDLARTVERLEKRIKELEEKQE